MRTDALQDPPMSDSGFTSAKSQTIGSAWRANTPFGRFSFVYQGTSEEPYSAYLSTANARYVHTASAYALGAPSATMRSLTSPTSLVKVDRALSWRAVKRSRRCVSP